MKAWIARRNWWAILFWTLLVYATLSRYNDGWIAMLGQALILWALYSMGQESANREEEIKQLPKDKEAEDFWNWF